jgi:hypothetical protein
MIKSIISMQCSKLKAFMRLHGAVMTKSEIVNDKMIITIEGKYKMKEFDVRVVNGE